MTLDVSANTQAILLLTAPLLLGRAAASKDVLSPRDYRKLARHLVELDRQPADLLGSDSSALVDACGAVIDAERLSRLLARGFLLSQVLERWRARSIWVISRADPTYPRRLKKLLRDDAPAVLYGCGDHELLNRGGLAIVGSRNVEAPLIEYTERIGQLAARNRRVIVSGGARGVDRAAMQGALREDGWAVGVLADGLEKSATRREFRDALIDSRLVLVSPFDPAAGFNVGHAMQRNKLIYAFSDVSLVVNADVGKGGTWAGAVEQLEKLRFVPVFVRSSGSASAGLAALKDRGAKSWPEPDDEDSFQSIFEAEWLPATTAEDSAPEFSTDCPQQPVLPMGVREEALPSVHATRFGFRGTDSSDAPETLLPDSSGLARGVVVESANDEPQAALFSAVRPLLRQLLTEPMSEAEVADALAIVPAQARAWLQQLVDEGVIEKRNRPVRYIARKDSLFD